MRPSLGLAALAALAVALAAPERPTMPPASTVTAASPAVVGVKTVTKYAATQVKPSDVKPIGQQPPAPKPPAPPTLLMPDEVHVARGELAQILIQTDPGTALHYVWVGPKGASVFREFEPDPTKVAYQVLGTKPGTFYLVVFAVRDGQVAKASCAVVVDGPAPPAPSPPGPGPGPSPTPTDPLAAGLQAAYTADPAPPAAKQHTLTALAGLYQAMATRTNAGEFATLADVRRGLSVAGAALNLGDSLLAVRKLVAAEISAAMGPAPDAKMEPALKTKMVNTFGRVAAALAQVK